LHLHNEPNNKHCLRNPKPHYKIQGIYQNLEPPPCPPKNLDRFQNPLAHNELQETGELTMEDAGYHQTNLIEAIATRVAELQPATPSASPAPPAALTNDSILPTIVAQMQQMMAAMQTTTNNRQPATTLREQHPQPTGPRTGEPNRPLPPWATKYCWTHGKCAHVSARCNNQAPGHQSNATMENKQMGSTYWCT
jgi:hypothetical protein